MFKWFKKFHRHDFYKIIASQYHTFNLRRVVVECKCGKRVIEKWHHDNVYPFLTNILITNKEMEDIKNYKNEHTEI
jgi:hypothetical protein